jgi:type VI secretion system protein ImpH
MASEGRPAEHPLMHELEENPERFDFFQAVRRIECLHADLPRVGHSQHVAQDPVRFRQVPSLAFAPSTVVGYTAGSGGRPAQLSVAFMGLLGPNGPMPLHLTQYARERVLHHSDHALVGFLDVFNHRMISLFYRAWATGKPVVNYERRGADRFSIHLASLFGMGLESLRHADAVSEEAKQYYAGRLARATRNAEGLAAILEGYFGVPAGVEQFVGRWLHLPPECLCRLGGSPSSATLGTNAIVGARVWECQQTFHVRLGPMGLKQFVRLLPGGSSLARLTAWVRNYTGDELSWAVRLVLRRDDVPETCLGRAGNLGWCTWLKTRPFERDAEDLLFTPLAA